MKRFANPLFLHHPRDKDRHGKAAAVENAMPPSLTVAKPSAATELDRINAMGRTPTEKHAREKDISKFRLGTKLRGKRKRLVAT